ncbi:MAG: Mut7-C RNAse domain-containing protein [Dehalococcoidales bacterium]
MGAISTPRFIVDHNVGKLARWLRMMGYDTLFFSGGDDSGMIATAVAENRVILTRDTQIMERRLVTSGRLRAVLIGSDEPEQQMRQVLKALGLEPQFRPFTLCLECNQPLVERSKQQVKERVPPHVFKTQDQYMECPLCNRIYWRGSHWQAMSKRLSKFKECQGKDEGL